MSSNWRNSIKTIEQARDFILQVGTISFLHDSKGGCSLWDAVDAADTKLGESGESEKEALVWLWKNELPALYPNEIFYGKRKSGAMLCTIEELKRHYAENYRPLEALSENAKRLFHLIEQAPVTNRELRELAYLSGKEYKTAFDKAMNELQVTYQIVRIPAGQYDPDTWTTFASRYPDIAHS